jgi:hypothetical protein
MQLTVERPSELARQMECLGPSVLVELSGPSGNSDSDVSKARKETFAVTAPLIATAGVVPNALTEVDSSPKSMELLSWFPLVV